MKTSSSRTGGLLSGLVMLALLGLASPASISAQSGPTWCYQCGWNGSYYECLDWVSGWSSCEEQGDSYCIVNGANCESAPTDIQLALGIAPSEILSLPDGEASRAFAPVSDNLYIAWNCRGAVVAVRERTETGEFRALSIARFRTGYSLPELAGQTVVVSDR